MNKTVYIIGSFGRVGEHVFDTLFNAGYAVIGSDMKQKPEMAASDGLLLELARYSPDLVVSCVPGKVGYSIAETVIGGGYNFLDVSFMPEIDSIDHLSRLAAERSVAAVLDCGISPGISNVLATHFYQKERKPVTIKVGGISADPYKPLGLTASWNFEDLQSEYVRGARYMHEGTEYRTAPKMSKKDFKVGPLDLEGFRSDGVRTMLGTIPDIDEWTLRWPGHMQAIEQGELKPDVLEEGPDLVVLEVECGKSYLRFTCAEKLTASSTMARVTAESVVFFIKSFFSGHIVPRCYGPELFHWRAEQAVRCLKLIGSVEYSGDLV